MILGITSGCFDLVHHGHVVYLERCKALCDYLVVGVDSDRMVRKVKGEERPIIPAEQRLLMVEALKPVDEVFELKSLRGLEAKVRAVPDTFTEVRMFKHEGFADMDHVVGVSGTRAELVIVPDVPGLVSTTEIVNRIKGLNPRREWTYSDVKMLKALWDRRCAGESTPDLAEELGMTSSWLRRLWARYGMSAEEEFERQQSDDGQLAKVHGWRFHDRLSYRECCERLGIEATRKNAHNLRARHITYCERNLFPFPEVHTHREQARERNAKLVKWKKQGLSYGQMCDKLDIPRTRKNEKTLSSGLRSYCIREGLEWPITSERKKSRRPPKDSPDRETSTPA